MIFLISANKIKKITGTADTLNDEAMRVGIYQAQAGLITPLIGIKLSEYLGELVVAENVIGDYKTLIEDYLQPIIAWQALSNMTEPNNSNTTIGMSHQVDIVADNTKLNRDHYRWIAESYVRLAKHYLCRVQFPYYNTRQINIDANFMGIELGINPKVNREYAESMIDKTYYINHKP
jgi:hypothetical protein